MAVVVVDNSANGVALLNASEIDRPMDVQTALTQQFIHKLRARNADRDQIEESNRVFRGIRFEDYEESCSARMMQFDVSRAEQVIERFCSSNGWDEQTGEDLKFAAALLDEDRKAETWIKFQKGVDGEFYVHFVALRRYGEKIHMGLARHRVKFTLSPFSKDSKSERRHESFFEAWWQTFDKRDQQFSRDTEDGGQRNLSLHEIEMLENYFLLKAMIKFTETFPVNVNRLPEEDRKYLTYEPVEI